MHVTGLGGYPPDSAARALVPPAAQPSAAAGQNVPEAAGNARKAGPVALSNPTAFWLSADNLAALLNLQESLSTPGSAIVAPEG